MPDKKKKRSFLLTEIIPWLLTAGLLAAQFGLVRWAALNALQYVYSDHPEFRGHSIAMTLEGIFRHWASCVFTIVAIVFVCIVGVVCKLYDREISRTTVIVLFSMLLLFAVCKMFGGVFSGACRM